MYNMGAKTMMAIIIDLIKFSISVALWGDTYSDSSNKLCQFHEARRFWCVIGLFQTSGYSCAERIKNNR